MTFQPQEHAPWQHPSTEESVEEALEMRRLLQERGGAYGDAWILTTEIVEFIMSRRPSALAALVTETPYLYAWITILCKLLRALSSPKNADHWKDISGYATLCAEHIESGSRGRM